MLSLGIFALGGPSPVGANAQVAAQTGDLVSRVVGGELSKTCAWPSTVQVGGCTGTLVHPKLVVYAAHCGSRVSKVRFGEKRPFARSVATERCETYPGGGQPELGGNHRDYAYCILAEEVTDVPIIPIMYGCETEQIKVGGKAYMAGFGATGSKAGDPGIQRELEVTIDRIDDKNGKLSVNGNGEGKGCCYGDSGGPLFIRLDKSLDPEQSWRLVGVTSYGDDEPECSGQGWFGMMHDQEAVPWIEKQSGIDITPCHDVDGNWQPTQDCGRFPLEPGTPAKGWEEGCSGGPVGKMSSTCGPAFGEDGEDPKEEENQDSDEEDEGSGSQPKDSDSGSDAGSSDTQSDADSSKASDTGSTEDKNPSSDDEDDDSSPEEAEPKQKGSGAKGCHVSQATPMELMGGILVFAPLVLLRRRRLGSGSLT